MGDLEEILLSVEDKKVRISRALPNNLKSQLVAFLMENHIVLAWCPIDMLGIDPSIITHKLGILLGYKLVKQVKRPLHGCQLAAARDEIQNLKVASFI